MSDNTFFFSSIQKENKKNKSIDKKIVLILDMHPQYHRKQPQIKSNDYEMHSTGGDDDQV